MKDIACTTDCPECGGNGSIGGDTDSAWVCTKRTARYMRVNRLGWYGTPAYPQSVAERLFAETRPVLKKRIPFDHWLDPVKTHFMQLAEREIGNLSN